MIGTDEPRIKIRQKVKRMFVFFQVIYTEKYRFLLTEISPLRREMCLERKCRSVMYPYFLICGLLPIKDWSSDQCG